MGSLISKSNEKILLGMDNCSFFDNKLKVDMTVWEKNDYIKRQKRKHRYLEQ